MKTKDEEISRLKDIINQMQEHDIGRLTNDLSNIISFSSLVFGVVAVFATISIGYMSWTNKKVKKDAERVKLLQEKAEKAIEQNNEFLKTIESRQLELDSKEEHLTKLTKELNAILESSDIKEKLENIETTLNEKKISEWNYKLDQIKSNLGSIPNVLLNPYLSNNYYNLLNTIQSIDSDIKNNNFKNITNRINELDSAVIYYKNVANSPHFRED